MTSCMLLLVLYYVVLEVLLVSTTSHGSTRINYSSLLSLFRGTVVNGRDVNPGEYPSQLSLQLLGAHNCGASVLNARFALTAAHCVQGTPLPFLSVQSGTTDINSYSGTRHYVRSYVVHEKYNPELSWVNDIAILEVSPRFIKSSLVQPISLPLHDQYISSGRPATVIGWGRTSPRGPISSTLKEVQIEIREQWLCQSVYDAIGFHVFPSQICADVPQGHRGSCNGDSGGPLFVDGTVVGLVSWALGCATPGYPTVYTRVSFYRDWIAKHALPTDDLT